MIFSFFAIAFRFIAVLFVLVLAHEWGHFFVARKFGVRVHEFGFGFPPRIKKMWHSRGTDYTLNWIPLGGFVRLKGEDGADRDDTDSFAHKPAWQRLLILVAGVAMNFVLGYILILIVLGVGTDMPVLVVGPHAQISGAHISVGGVLAGSPAARAGILLGDDIISVDGTPSTSAAEVRAMISTHAQVGANITPATLVVRRGGADIAVSVKPELLPSAGVVGLGVQMLDMAHVRYDAPYVFVQAARETVQMSTMIFKSLGTVITKLVRHGKIEEGVAGPVGIAVVTSEVAKTGIMPFLEFIAMLSINLGILNVLPFPALDGGRAVFVVLEKIVRRKVRAELERAAHLIGFALLMTLVIVVTYRDIVGLFK